MHINRFVTLFLALFIAGLTNSVAANQATHDTAAKAKIITNPAAIPVVKYNKEKNQLTVKVKQVPLYQVLTAISRQSGTQMLMDASLTFSITANFENQPLFKGLKQLLRKTNSAYFFDNKKSGKEPLLLAVKVLPKGTQSSNNLKPLMGLPQEAMHHQRNQNAQKGKKTQFSFANKRWLARLEHMPEDKRARLEEMTKKRLAAEAERKKKQAKYKEKMKAQRMEKRKQRQARRAARDKDLKENHPDLYAERERARAEGRERVRQGQDERGILTFAR